MKLSEREPNHECFDGPSYDAQESICEASGKHLQQLAQQQQKLALDSALKSAAARAATAAAAAAALAAERAEHVSSSFGKLHVIVSTQ